MDENVPWFVDLSHNMSDGEGLTLPATAPVNYRLTPWVQVSHDCHSGATVSILPAGHIKVIDQVKASASTFEAIHLYAFAPGSVMLVVRQGGKVVSSTHIEVTTYNSDNPCTTIAVPSNSPSLTTC